MKSEIITPQHELKDFSIDRLCGPEDCDWGEDGWPCHGPGDNRLHDTPATLSFATRILMLIPNIDVEGSIMTYGFSKKRHR